jgi:hypothetical protein
MSTKVSQAPYSDVLGACLLRVLVTGFLRREGEVDAEPQCAGPHVFPLRSYEFPKST